MPTNILWLQISDDGTNRICRVSKDGQNFYQIHSVARTDYLTATEVGVYVDPYSKNCNITLCSWNIA